MTSTSVDGMVSWVFEQLGVGGKQHRVTCCQSFLAGDTDSELTRGKDLAGEVEMTWQRFGGRRNDVAKIWREI